jgi:predicted DNA-binding helix-hairpin-helix protein
MNLEERLKILRRSARFDLCGDCDLSGNGRVRAEGDRWDYPELVPDGKNSIMLRVLLSNRCENNCAYCENAASRDFPAASISPDEVAAHFAALYQASRAWSLFLSSAVQVSADHSMERIVDTLELIRFRYRIPTYIHAKILPGASEDLIRRTVRLATRVSVNLEVPNKACMKRLGAPKDFEQDLYGRVRFISSLLDDPEYKRRGTGRKKSQTTQFVVGAAGETDGEILSMSSHLYGDLDLSRIYFSAFQRPGRVDFGAPRAPLVREHRLYQADFLLRKYGFEAGEIPLDEGNRLALHEDPKSAWARLHPEFFPVEVNQAERRALFRVPGLGPVSVRRILKARAKGRITSRVHLEELGIRPRPALAYLLLDGVKAGGGDGAAQAVFGFS